MAHIPYGYKIVGGRAEIDEKQAEAVRKLFQGYIQGLGLMAAAQNAGLNIFHTSAGRILRNIHYLGDEYYPAIIDRELFDKVEEIRKSKAKSLGRVRKLEVSQKPAIYTKFTIHRAKKKNTDPFEQAEYIYSLIESEVAEIE